MRPVRSSHAILLLTALAAACDSQPEAPAIGYVADTSLAAFTPAPDSTGFVTVAIRQMGEPPLPGATVRKGSTVIRFVWARSFQPYVAVRLVIEPKQCSVVTTAMTAEQPIWGSPDKPGGQMAIGTSPGKVIRRDSMPLLAGDCKALRSTLDRLGLWQVPSRPMGGVDGSVWRFERVDANGYTRVQWWSPNPTEGHQLWSAGLALLKLGGALPSGPHELY